MIRSSPIILLVVLAGGVSISTCRDSPDPGDEATGFSATVTGAVNGQVSGPGLVRYLPPAETSFGTRPGYFFVADDSGVREFGITFTIPAGTEPGSYQLVSANPLETGTQFEVRVDRSVGDRTESFETNTEGTITLEAFPSGADDTEGGRCAGTFELSVQDKDGREIEATGSFDFAG